MRPVSIINHNTIIPKNQGGVSGANSGVSNGHPFRETFNTVTLPKSNIYKITSITCKIDTTSLWNIRQTNLIKIINTSGQSVYITVSGGYYSADTLCEVAGKCIAIDSNNLAYVTTGCKSIDFTDAPDYCNIFHFEKGKVYVPNDKVSEVYDITNGLGVIKVYSSIMKQTFGIKSSFIDNLIHVSIGLNNIVSIDNLNIDVIDQSNLDSIEWLVTDMNDNPITMNSNVYVSFTITCFQQE